MFIIIIFINANLARSTAHSRSCWRIGLQINWAVDHEFKVLNDAKKISKIGTKITGWTISWRTWVGLTLICDVPPSCPAAQPLLPISHQPKQNGAQWNSQNPSQQNPGSPGDGSPCRLPRRTFFLTKFRTPHHRNHRSAAVGGLWASKSQDLSTQELLCEAHGPQTAECGIRSVVTV